MGHHAWSIAKSAERVCVSEVCGSERGSRRGGEIALTCVEGGASCRLEG